MNAQHRDTDPTGRTTAHPGALLRSHVLPGLRLSVTQAARDLGVTRQAFHRVLAGDAALTPEMAVRLERLCGIPSEFWLNCQNRFELQHVGEKLAPELARIPRRVLPEETIQLIGVNHGH
ncbi:HigA family addiction module antitoxin [Ancylobacter sp.]|uniref:HigA family addiction module antitoxin n=1 Tax=Ancylobacter sp. TaxID=1872567 RepID=UPI003D0D7750